MVKKIKSLLIPKTGQTIVYDTDDDGETQIGWWSKRTIANNRVRYVTKTIGGDDIVFDRATGLTWAADGAESGCNGGGADTWAFALDYAENLNFAGFTDWRLPTAKEGMAIIKMDYATWFATKPLIDDPPFVNFQISNYWTSTTYPSNTANAYKLNLDSGAVSSNPKANAMYIVCVRGGI